MSFKTETKSPPMKKQIVCLFAIQKLAYFVHVAFLLRILSLVSINEIIVYVHCNTMLCQEPMVVDYSTGAYTAQLALVAICRSVHPNRSDMSARSSHTVHLGLYTAYTHRKSSSGATSYHGSSFSTNKSQTKHEIFPSQS